MKYEREILASKKDQTYPSKKRVERDSLVRKEKVYKKTDIVEPSLVLKPSQKIFNRTQSFEWDLFQWTDYDFVQWANKQPSTLVIAIMAEIKQSPRMKPSIEMLRPKVASIPLCSIEIYRKKKRLGERSVDFLKQMKKKYGPSILRILYVTSDS